MRKVDRKVVQIFFLALMFVMMCMLRLWFAVLLFMAAGIVAVMVQRKRSYCGYVCPMGTLAELTGQGSEKQLALPKAIRVLAFVLFFSVLSVILITRWGQTQALWQSLLQFAITIAVFTILVQFRYKKRTWCTSLCPIGTIQGVVSSSTAASPVIDAERCTQCGACTTSCPLPVELAPPNVSKVDPGKCLQCQACLKACQFQAIEMN